MGGQGDSGGNDMDGDAEIMLMEDEEEVKQQHQPAPTTHHHVDIAAHCAAAPD